MMIGIAILILLSLALLLVSLCRVAALSDQDQAAAFAAQVADREAER